MPTIVNKVLWQSSVEHDRVKGCPMTTSICISFSLRAWLGSKVRVFKGGGGAHLDCRGGKSVQESELAGRIKCLRGLSRRPTSV